MYVEYIECNLFFYFIGLVIVVNCKEIGVNLDVDGFFVGGVFLKVRWNVCFGIKIYDLMWLLYWICLSRLFCLYSDFCCNGFEM